MSGTRIIAAADVVLVAMPWATVLQPSLQLGILSAHLARAGIASRCLYANIRFGQEVGPDRYERYGTYDSIFSQWVFAESLFGDFRRDPPLDQPDFIAFAAAQGISADRLAELVRVKSLVPDFLEWCVDAVDWRRARVVGFTTTLLQTLPSLALAKRLKREFPHLKVLMGGAGCTGSMGAALHRWFPFVDGVVDGEADATVAPLAAAILAKRTPAGIPGLIWRQADGTGLSGGAPQIFDMADYPRPLYDDYFAQADASLRRLSHAVRVPFEASRGCWWAVRRQCKFCGLNGDALAQRPRDVAAVMDELVAQGESYGARFFFAADNIIAPQHVTRLPAAVSERLPGVELFFEARVVMQRGHFEGLTDAGIVHLQAGVESLIPEVLEMVDKGTTPADNLCFLRRASEFGAKVYWNMLYGFPREERSWYDDLLPRLPGFFHLPAPDVIRFSLQRFSPYFDRSGQYGITVTGCHPGSRYVWDLPDSAIEDLSFDIGFTVERSWDLGELDAALRSAVDLWKTSGARLDATLLDGGEIAIDDTRPGFAGRYAIPMETARLLRLFEKPLSWRKACDLLRLQPEPVPSAEALAARLGWLAERGLLYRDREAWVSLVLPSGAGFWLGHGDPGTVRALPEVDLFRPVSLSR